MTKLPLAPNEVIETNPNKYKKEYFQKKKANKYEGITKNSENEVCVGTELKNRTTNHTILIRINNSKTNILA